MFTVAWRASWAGTLDGKRSHMSQESKPMVSMAVHGVTDLTDWCRPETRFVDSVDLEFRTQTQISSRWKMQGRQMWRRTSGVQYERCRGSRSDGWLAGSTAWQCSVDGHWLVTILPSSAALSLVTSCVSPWYSIAASRDASAVVRVLLDPPWTQLTSST